MTVQVDDLEGLGSMLASPLPEIAARMDSHGVLPPVVVYIER